MKMLKLNQVVEKLGFSRSKVYKMMENGEFPSGQKIGRNRRWCEDHVNTYIIMYWDLPDTPPNLDAEVFNSLKEKVKKAKLLL